MQNKTLLWAASFAFIVAAPAGIEVVSAAGAATLANATPFDPTTAGATRRASKLGTASRITAPVKLRPKPPVPNRSGGFVTVDDETWDETAVRKVLFAFAYGGQASDQQIKNWADMDPRSAISEMLTWDQHNVRLSAPSGDDTDNLLAVPNRLQSLSSHWNSPEAWNQMPGERRESFSKDNWGWPIVTWLQAAVSRGLNPFRERMGLWESNYHMAVTMARGAVYPGQVARYYDDIMEAHAEGQAYQDVMATAAISAAVTRQYGHGQNRFEKGVCDCNEDFGREFHQLFFGVFGEGDRNYHETVTIKNTARMLTDLRTIDPAGMRPAWEGQDVTFGMQYHYPFPLDVGHETYFVASAREQISALAQNEIVSQESLNNLPLIIVRGLGDDSLDDAEVNAVRGAWAKMQRKDLLNFIREYAISTTFHSPNRMRYKTSFDRFITLANLTARTNNEQYLDLIQSWRMLYREHELPFSPDWGVFGGQTGRDAADNANLFRENYNAMANSYRFVTNDGTAFGREYHRDWTRLVPRDGNGTFSVGKVGEWLWQRLIADGLKNFGPVEQAYVYALLGTGQDLSTVVHPNSPDQPPTEDEIRSGTVQKLVNTWRSSTLALDSAAEKDRTAATQRLAEAISFIAATPYIFVQEGR